MLIKRTKFDVFLHAFMESPGRIIVSSFLLVILLGTALLSLPFATYPGVEFNLFDAFFTATSATCVTGLIVTDTATSFTIFGKIVLIILIQIGGLGLVTITSFFLAMSGKKIGINSRKIALESAGSFNYSELPFLLKVIVGFTATVEFIGAILLSIAYVPEYGWKEGLAKAIFQAISAYCNAGFDLMGNTQYGKFSSLTGYVDNPLVVITTSMLILLGGLGFIVWVDLVMYRKTHTVKTHTRIMLKASVVLVVLGMILLYVFELSNPDSEITNGGIGHSLLTTFFQSVTFRTAGFNTIDLKAMTPASKTISIVLMFIGAGSGSTGGGVKITTFVVVLYMMTSELTGKKDIIVEKSKVSMKLCHRAVALMLSGVFVVVILSALLSISEYDALLAGKFDFLDIVFESTSAFATVGVTSAGTPDFSTLGQAFIIPAMFLGRVGPVSLALSIVSKENNKIKKVYPDASINIG